MKIIDIIFALICGCVANWVAFDFGIFLPMFFWVLPAVSLFSLWLADIIGKNFLFIFQASKYLLTGFFATVVDLKIFEFLTFLFLISAENILVLKGVSFIIATSIKYWGNKHWAFEKHEKENQNREVVNFFTVTVIGLIIDVCAFFYFTNILGTKFGLTYILWTKISVILAAAVAALWNFVGYKFLVFKK